MAIEIDELREMMLDAMQQVFKDGKASPSSSGMKKAATMSFDEYKKYIASLKKTSKTYDSLTSTIEDLDDAIEKATDDSEKSVLKSKKRLIEEERISAAKRESIVKFANALDSSAKAAVAGATKMAGSLVDNALSGGNAFRATGDMMSTVGSMVGTAGKSLGDGITKVGSALMMVNPIIGGIVAGFGMLVGTASAATEKLIKFGSDVLVKELEKTVKGYADASSAGALFANGMQGLRDSAHAAGMTTVMFTNTLKNSSAELAAAGMSVSGAISQVGRVSQAMDAKGIRTKLQSLGYAIEEHGSLIATVMADMSRVDPTKKLNDDQVAQQTAKYAENLRLISAITGEDAKKKMEESRQAANTLAFQQKLAKKPAAEQAEIIRAMSGMTAQGKQNFMDMVNFGSVINKNGAILEAQMPAVESATKQYYAAYKDGTMSLGKVTDINASLSDAQRQQALAADGLATAGVALPGSLAETMSKIMLDTMQQANKYTKDAVANATKDLEAQGKTLDPLTGSVNEAQNAMVKMGQELEKLTDKPMKNFAAVTTAMVGAMKDAVTYFNELVGKSKPASKEAEEAAKSPGGMINAKAQQARMDQDAFIAWKKENGEKNHFALWDTDESKAQKERFEKARESGWKPTETVDPMKADLERRNAEYKERYRAKKQQDALKDQALKQDGIVKTVDGEVKDGPTIQRKNGGLSDGPESGYKAILHGTEAVVPLPDGKNLPVTLNIPDTGGPSVISKTTEVMTINNEMLKKQLDLMTQFVEKADELVDAVKEQKSIQQSILQATY